MHKAPGSETIPMCTLPDKEVETDKHALCVGFTMCTNHTGQILATTHTKINNDDSYLLTSLKKNLSPCLEQPEKPLQYS